ncbi:unnamed protein product [Phaeothamnion confervicola]
MWEDRQQCLSLRLGLKRHCPPLFAKSGRTFTECTRPPGTYWGAPSPDTTDKELQALREDCRSQKFLLWTRNSGDYWAGHSHKSWSMECSFGEAANLSRVLVYDDFAAMDGLHVGRKPGPKEGVEVPIGAWHDDSELQKLPAMPWSAFARRCGMRGVLGSRDVVSVPRDTQISTMEQIHAPLLIRNFSSEGDTGTAVGAMVKCLLSSALSASYYGFEACMGAGVPRLDDDWQYMPLSDRLSQKAAEIYRRVAAAGGQQELVCVHVRRGDKVGSPDYPHLDADTRPDALRRLLPRLVQPGSSLYIATNEPHPARFFEPLGDVGRMTASCF